jgi:flagellar basal-body rod protein FlgC
MSISDNNSLINGLRIATSGMIAQNKRLAVITQNIANAGSKSATTGMPYGKKSADLVSYIDKKSGVEMVKIKKVGINNQSYKRVYNPSDPLADKDGYILESNVNTILEMSDMRDASRSHEAATKAFEKILQMLHNMIGLLK